MGRALTVAEWFYLEDEIDAFSITKTVKEPNKKKEYYRFIFADTYYMYDAHDFDRVLELWKRLDEMGVIDV